MVYRYTMSISNSLIYCGTACYRTRTVFRGEYVLQTSKPLKELCDGSDVRDTTNYLHNPMLGWF